jgi:hypothetical protein
MEKVESRRTRETDVKMEKQRVDSEKQRVLK